MSILEAVSILERMLKCVNTKYVKFPCECCPLTFRNWLDEEVEE